jgi:hypothetical protein
MDLDYHIKLVRNETTSYKRTENDALLVSTAETMYPAVKVAMTQVVADGDYEKYVNGIAAYDKFVWEESHKGDKTNIFSYKKIKVSPSWTEQLWAPVFERVRQKMAELWSEGNLVLIQNTEVVEAMGSMGPVAYKDVDCGIGVQVLDATGHAKYILPIIVSECKTGHYCKTACTGVDAIIARVRRMNSSVMGFALTDNNISVGREQPVENVFGSGGILISQRGQNGRRTPYPALRADVLKTVETLCVNYLKTMHIDNFTNVNTIMSTGVLLRDSIDRDGYYIPDEYRTLLG